MNFQVSTTDTDDTTLAVISLGSTLGAGIPPKPAPQGNPAARDTEASAVALLDQALASLAELSKQPVSASAYYRTAPVDMPPGTPDFINAVALLRVDAAISALDLLRQLHTIEARFGRQRSAGLTLPRSLDLDLVSFGTEQCAGRELVLPHPRAHERLFVMLPLAEIAPELKLPGQAFTARQLVQQLQLRHKSSDLARACRRL